MRTKSLTAIILLFAGTSLFAQGYFRVQQQQGVWWLVDPTGAPTLSIGVDAIRYEGDRIQGTGASPYMETVSKKYESHSAWTDATIRRLREWGFNTIGSWSGPELYGMKMAYTVNLDFAAKAGANWQHGVPVDVYAPRFEETVKRIAAVACAKYANDPWLIGYYSDNELRWGPDWRGNDNMLQMYLALATGSPGREKALEFLRQRYGNSVARLNAAWKSNAADFESARDGVTAEDNDLFLEQVAKRYFQVSAEAIRAADPNHLYLGARFSGTPPEPVLRAARIADVISINIYDFDPRPLVQHVYEVTGRPVLITEFAFRGIDSGLPNTRGAGPRVADQKARARAYANFITQLESLPEAIGYHWFKWSDEPKEGRFDGEDSNYGLVNERDEPYSDFVAEVRTANDGAVRVHQRAGQAQSSGPKVRSKLSIYDLQDNSVRVVYTADYLLEAPNWSPDGKYLLANSGGALYRFALDGPSAKPEKVALAPEYACNNDHGISPDGKLLAFSASTPSSKGSQVFVAGIDGSESRLLTANVPSYFHGWSPDGRWLAFVGERGGNFDIYRVAVSGGAEQGLTSHAGYDDGPDYTPDGKWIYLNSDRSGSWDIWRIPANGAGANDAMAEQVTADELEDWFPHVSPDGKWIVFLSFPQGTKGHNERGLQVQLRLAPVQNGKVRPGDIRVLTTFTGGQGTINVNSWSPDSKQFAFVSYEPLQ